MLSHVFTDLELMRTPLSYQAGFKERQLLGRRVAISFWLPHLKELSITVAAFWTAYFVYLSTGHMAYSDLEATAIANAWRVIELERCIGIFWEPAWQEWVITIAPPLAGKGGVAVFFNWAYILTFAPLMGTVAVILYAMNRTTYRHYRKIFLLSYGIAIIVFIAFPLAPPRMIPSHFVDTIAAFGPSGYGTQDMGKYYNAYAAMPSLHFGWAVVFGVFFLRVPNVLVKICGLIYPALMLSAIVMTGNHYIVDAIGGGLVILVSFLFVELHLWQRLLGRAQFLARNLSSAFHSCFLICRRRPGSSKDDAQDCNPIGKHPGI